ncbi:MAG: APC family permease, partial [Clostridia bacterium]|nr:APC family permease [Clostridia bacterium]
MEEKTLKKELSPMHVWAIAFGCVIGWGSFINPGKKFLPNSGVAGTAIAMVLGALVMIIIAFSYAYMIPKFPKAGGEFTFSKNCFGKVPAYICGWFLVAAYLTNVPMNSTAIGLIVDGIDGKADILKFGFHYSIAGFEVWLGEILLAGSILILFGVLNILGVKKAGFVQTILAATLATCAFTLFISALISSKAKGINMEPIWGFDKAAAMAANATTENIAEFAHVGRKGVLSAILATFAIAPWAYVGFDTIPQAAEEFKFSYKKVMGIMVVAIAFGCFVYSSHNAVAAAALTNWPDRVMAGEWVLLI